MTNNNFIPFFTRDSNQAIENNGIYKVDIKNGAVYPCYNIYTSGYINGGQFGLVLDNDDTNGVDIEKYHMTDHLELIPYLIKL